MFHTIGRGRFGVLDLVVIEPMRPRGHDDRVGLVLGQPVVLDHAVFRVDQLVVGQIGEIVQRLDAALAKGDQHGRGQAGDCRDLVGDAELAALRGEALLLLGEEDVGAIAQLLGDLLVEALDADQIRDRHIGDFLDR